MRILPILAVLMMAAPAFAEDIPLPADVSGYFHRVALCRDNPDQRDADLLLCSELASDKKALLEKYNARAEIVDALNRI